MKWIEPETYPSTDIEATDIVTIPIPAEYRGAEILKIQVIPVSGDATSSAPVVSTDSAVTDRAQQIAAFTAATSAAPVDHDNGGEGYAWAHSANVYVKPTPNAGTNNVYKIRLLMGRRP